MTKNSFAKRIDFKSLIRPETPLESELINLPEFKDGYEWGVPRFGHPEGKVGFHVREVLDNIEACVADEEIRRQLRIVALAHDTFKNLEHKTIREGKRINHGRLASRFMEDYIDDPLTLKLIEFHDEAYYSWRLTALRRQHDLAEKRFKNLVKTFHDHLGVYYLFFRCDTLTGDKIQAPRFWLEHKLRLIDSSGIGELIDEANATCTPVS